MRALMMDFSKDNKVFDINNEYMFGPSILVAPVVNAQYTPEIIPKTNEQTAAVNFTQPKSTKVYLPAGTSWYDFWTNQMHAGGQEVIKETSLKTIPLYIKAGSILPIGPNVQYATEKNWDNLEIRIYEGADGTFKLYEDENDNYNYEKGVFTNITFNWNDKSKTLTLNDREGDFPGMLAKRTFKIVIIKSGASAAAIAKEIAYTGRKVSLKF